MKKKDGFTLIELLVAMAILVIMVLMVAPLMSSISKTNRRTQELNQLDINVGRTIDVFKRAVRSSKPIEKDWNVTGTAIYLAEDKNAGELSSTTTATAIVINVPREKITATNDYEDEKVVFYYDTSNSSNKRLMLNSTTGTTMPTTYSVILVENVLDANFGYKNNIATIYLKVKLDPKEDDATARFKEIRDAAVTRINIQF